jgi:large subunit ribosomal protein L10
LRTAMRPEKKSVVDELRTKIGDSSFVILTNYRGLNVLKTEELRRRLRGVRAQFQVIQNSLFRRAAKEIPSFTVLEEKVEGPSAMVYGKGDVVQAARVLREFAGENELPVVTAGALQGTLLTPSDVNELAQLPSREVLLARLVGTIAAPMSQLVGVLRQKVASIVYVLKAIEEKKQKEKT